MGICTCVQFCQFAVALRWLCVTATEEISRESPSTCDADAEELGKQQQYANKDQTGVPKPLQNGLLTLSGDPMSKWDSLVHLDAIKARNKPAQPAKKPESAPFFLPTMEQQQMSALGVSVEDLFAQAADDAKAQLDRPSGQLHKSSQPGNQSVQQSPLLSLLVRDHKHDGDFSDALQWLQKASPVFIEREIASVDATAPCDEVHCSPTNYCRIRSSVWKIWTAFSTCQLLGDLAGSAGTSG